MADNNQQNNQQNTQEDVGRLRQVRRDKLSDLQSQGRDPFQIVKYDQTHHTKDIRDKFDELEFVELDKHNPENPDLLTYLGKALDGRDIGLMSEAGTPCVADPGALIVELAHQAGIQVVPLTGPNAMILALMASGFNGQSFCFHGYLPIKNPERVQKIKALGGEVEYYQCDITNGSMLKDVVTKIKNKYGTLDGLIHFAGLEHSKLLTDKTVEEYYKVFSVKATSAAAFIALNLVKEKGFYAFASSIAGKFGNLGQSDYASASDYLSKLALTLHRQGQRAVSIAMSAYSKIGMGVRPGVFEFLTKQGLKFVDPEVGMEIFLDEIVYGTRPEIILTDDLGSLDWDKQICFNEENLYEEDIAEEETKKEDNSDEGSQGEDNNGEDDNSNNTPSLPEQDQTPVPQISTQEDLFSFQEQPKEELAQPKSTVQESKQEQLFDQTNQEPAKEEDKTDEKDNFFLGQIVSLIKNQELFNLLKITNVCFVTGNRSNPL